MQLAEIVRTSSAVSRTPRRLEKIARLAACVRAAGPARCETVVAWLSGELRQGRIGVGAVAMRRALEAAPALRPALSVEDVERALDEIAGFSGRGSAAERRRRLGALFSRATAEEQRFLARLLVGEVRQGALEGVMAEAIARAAGLPASDVRRAVMLEGSLPAVARAAMGEGAAGLARFALQPFRPVRPMLASPAESPADALLRLGEAAFEYKLDGARVQVHKGGGEVRVYSRALREVTPAVPELVEAVAALPARELVLDGEILALRPDGRPQPFQTTMRRFGRRLDVATLRAQLPLRPFFFDVLRLEGADLLDAAAAERFAALSDALPEGLRVPRIVSADPAEAERFLRAALDAGHEGLLAKSLASTYAAGARGAEWLKLKPAYGFDLVVLAAEWGSGRRRGWLSNLHLGARDPRTGGFVMLGKTFKGLSDELLRWQTRELLARETHREGHVVHVRHELVVEIAVGDVQTSSQYPAGLALRFARVKGYRPDKRPEEADSVDSVRALYERTHG